MSAFSLNSLAQVSGTLVIDANGNLFFLQEGDEPRSGDVVIDRLTDVNIGGDISLDLIRDDGLAQKVDIDDLDAQAIIAQIEEGQDPTLVESQATAAGSIDGSSATTSSAITRFGAEVLATTEFDTSGLEKQGLTRTQALTLIQFLTNSAPSITSDELVGHAVEAGYGQDGSEFEGMSELSGQLTAVDNEFASETLTWSLVTLPDNLDNYGAFTLLPDGQWTFVLNNDSDAVQALNVDDVISLEFLVQVSDPLLGSTQQTTVITISGTNDKPVLNEDNATNGEVRESGHLDSGSDDIGTTTASGQLTAKDVDSDTLIWSALGELEKPYGTFDISEDGLWTFTIDNEAAQHLKEGAEVTYTFKVQVTDGDGGVVSQDISVLVKGTNDIPVIKEVDSIGSVTEKGASQPGESIATGAIIVTDVDDNASATYTLKETGDTTYGTFSVDKNTGQWTYTLDDSLPATNALSEQGKAVQLDYTVLVSDDKGATIEQTISVIINGSNDAPEIHVGQSQLDGRVAESGYLQVGESEASGLIKAGDVDAGATLSFGISVGNSELADSVTNEYGTFRIVDSETETWTFTLDDNSPQVQQLGPNEFKQLTFDIVVTDEHGATDIETVTVTINGANTPPEVMDIDVFAMDDTIPLNFADYISDLEDDLRSDAEALIRITELPEHGRLYIETPDGEGKAYLEVDDEVYYSERSNIKYELDRDQDVGFDVVSQLSDDDERGEQREYWFGADIVIQGGTYTGGQPHFHDDVDDDKDSFITFTDVDVKANGTPEHQGFYAVSGKNDSTGHKTSEGEFISARLATGSTNQASVTLSSLTGNFVNSSALFTVFLYLDGTFVEAKEFPASSLPLDGGGDKTAELAVTSGQPFDEVRIVATDLPGNSKGFGLQGVDFETGSGDVTDSFRYEAKDSHGQLSQGEDATVTIHISEEGNVPADSGYDSALHSSDSVSILHGTEGNDQLVGGASDDLLVGGAGSDLLTGGAGDDVFKWTESDLDGSVDVITDFRQQGDLDVIDLRDLFDESDSVQQLLDNNEIEVTEKRGNTQIDIEKDGKSVTIELEDVTGVDHSLLNQILLIHDS